MDVIGYARVVPQVGGTEALQHQRDRIESFCQSKRHNLLAFYQEQVSRDIGLDEGRQQLLDAIAALKQGQALLIVRLNKISGQKSMVMEAIKRIEARGAQLLTVDGSNDPDTMESTLQVTTIKPE